LDPPQSSFDYEWAFGIIKKGMHRRFRRRV